MNTSELNSKWAFDLHLNLDRTQIQPIGEVGTKKRAIVPISGGRFEGPTMKGLVLPGGADWVSINPDGNFEIDVRLTLKTAENELIYTSYQGVFWADEPSLKKYYKGELLNENQCYIRTVLKFETSSSRLSRLNQRLFIGKGSQTPSGVKYAIFEVQ